MRLRLPAKLSATLITTAVLLALPSVLLLALPRRSATGLDRLLAEAALLQSFAVRPTQAPPPLWQQRLGPLLAQRLWQSQRRLWWQFWGPHGDAGAYLVLTLPPSQPLPPGALRVDDLVVQAPSPLARQLLEQQLKLRRRAPRGLDQRCSQTLRQREAVHWNGVALAQMLGPLAPLALSLQQGCLQFSSRGKALLWQGEADPVSGRLSPAPAALAPSDAAPLPSPWLLQWRGEQLDLLLRGLLQSRLLRQELAQQYGLGPEQVRQLHHAAFQLNLQALPSGPFQAALQLQLQLPQRSRLWTDWLSDLSRALERQGLEPNRSAVGLTRWSREDGLVVGGWRWLPGGQLLFFLGPTPAAAGPAAASLTPLPPGLSWQLRLRPQALAAQGLLPEQLPLVVQRADQLVMEGKSRAGEQQAALAGRLDLP